MSPELRRLFLSAGHVSLAKLIPADARWLETWVNDPATTRYMATGRTPVAPGQLAAQIDAWKEPADWPFAIVLEGYQDPIGTVGLYGVDWISRKAEFRILIGAIYCGKGYGTLATKLALEFGFERLNLWRIWLGVAEDNTPAVRCYLKAGFSTEGLLVHDLYRDGRYLNNTRMAIRGDQWDMQKGRPVGTSESGPNTLGLAGLRSTVSSLPAEG